MNGLRLSGREDDLQFFNFSRIQVVGQVKSERACWIDEYAAAAPIGGVSRQIEGSMDAHEGVSQHREAQGGIESNPLSM